MTRTIDPQKCAACGNQWKTREDEIFKNVTEINDTKINGVVTVTTSMINGIVIASNFYKKKIQLYLCDKHFANPGFRNVIRYVNGTGVLQIRNVITNKWRKAEKIGVVVA